MKHCALITIACLLLSACQLGPTAASAGYSTGTAAQSSSSQQLLDVGRVLIEADRAYYGSPAPTTITTCHQFGNRLTCY